MAAETWSGGGRAGFVIVSGPVTRTSISDSSSMRPPSIITAQSSWTSSTRAHVHSQDLAGGCGRGAQPQAREAAAQRAGAVRRGQHLCRDPRNPLKTAVEKLKLKIIKKYQNINSSK